MSTVPDIEMWKAAVKVSTECTIPTSETEKMLGNLGDGLNGTVFQCLTLVNTRVFSS